MIARRLYTDCAICGGTGWTPGWETYARPEEGPDGQVHAVQAQRETQEPCPDCQTTGKVELEVTFDELISRAERAEARVAELIATNRAMLQVIEDLEGEREVEMLEDEQRDAMDDALEADADTPADFRQGPNL